MVLLMYFRDWEMSLNKILTPTQENVIFLSAAGRHKLATSDFKSFRIQSDKNYF